jgi:hypothetical protein
MSTEQEPHAQDPHASLLHHSTAEAQPFKQIAMDLITGLPKSEGYDAILTIIDHRCSRAAIFLPCHTTIIGPQIAQLYLNHVYKWVGLPKRIISDQDPQFTSHFGRSLGKELNINWNLSSAAHPQTDGLSKRKNQWIEQFLHLITANQHHWSKYLTIAILVHNNSKNASTGYVPSKLLIGWEPLLIPGQATLSNSQLAERTIEQLCQHHVLATTALNNIANNKAPKEVHYKQGQLVWLEAKYLVLPYGTIKLAPRQHGPFKITKTISPVAYKLELPHQWNIHPVFHASLLTPYVETIEHGPNYS